jgi:hypothetical protein
MEKYRIVSDGSPYGTKIYNPKGELMELVEKVEIVITAKSSVVKLTLCEQACEMDIKGEMENGKTNASAS